MPRVTNTAEMVPQRAEPPEPPRRPLKTRRTAWAKASARWLTTKGITPNQISCMSVVFALGAALCSLLVPRIEALGWRIMFIIGVTLCIQLRLMCNLLDGMVAIEGGAKTRSGEIYNDLPDRLSDTLILVAAGYAIVWSVWGPTLGWVAAVLAIFTAYVRVLGGAVGLPQDFRGPMAKQHRMALLTGAWLGSIFEALYGWHGWTLSGALAVIVVGATLTAVWRTQRIVRALEGGS